MKTIIKWPGGKSREIEKIRNLIPDFDRYIEPFFGGGAVYFSLEPSNAYINDISSMLMTFYKLVKEQDEDFKKYIMAYDITFQSLLNSTEKNYNEIYLCYKNNRDIANLVNTIISGSVLDHSLIYDKKRYTYFINKMVNDKFTRTKKNQEKKPFSEEDLKENLKTGFASGYYMYFRDVYNKLASKTIITDTPYKIANFYFIREYCYGSMFRYNSKGEFNIPYGGITYNNKNFSAKIDNLFNNSIDNLFKGTSIHTQDFEPFLDSLGLTEKDFIFLDPPYDTEFSDYEGRAFTKDDQYRLANVLKRVKAKFILIIKNTDFIYNLYENNFRILSFDKNYTYNVRSRNERNTEHLIITNIPG